jgi:hypothetical protein
MNSRAVLRRETSEHGIIADEEMESAPDIHFLLQRRGHNGAPGGGELSSLGRNADQQRGGAGRNRLIERRDDGDVAAKPEYRLHILARARRVDNRRNARG